MRKGRFQRAFIAIPLLMCCMVLIPHANAAASNQHGPPYPNLESFSFSANSAEEYMVERYSSITPSYHFPNLQNINAPTIDDYQPLDLTNGSFSLSGTTGPDGNVTGIIKFSGQGQSTWEDGNVDTYLVKAEGKITNAKAAFDDKGLLRVMGAAHYERKHEFSGTASITLTYDARGFDEDGDETRFSGTETAQAQIAFVSCISDLEEVNLCYFETGTGYGDYGFTAGFSNAKSQDYVWFNNLDFEFGLIAGIDFDPEAHHKLTPQAEEADDPEEMILDESYLDKPEKAEKIDENAAAGFSLSLSCSDLIYPEDGITCSLNIFQGTPNQPYTVNWIVDGYVIKSSTIILDADNFIFPNPPPGDHSIEVQVIDQSTFDARVSATNVEVLMPSDFDKIKPWTQAMASAGSVAILGAWLWAEWAAAKAKQDWFDKFYDDALKKDRDAWFEKQMALNDQKRAQQKAFDDYQKSCEKEWKRFRNALLKTVDKYEKSKYLVDLYDDMHSDVYRDGNWDGKSLQSLEELINTHLKMDRQHDAYSAWKREMNFLKKRQKAFSELTGSWSAMGAEVAAGILTGGASEMVFMPTRAIGNALYASKRAQLLGKTGWSAGKAIMVEAGIKLGLDYVFSKAGEKVIGKLFEYGGKGAKRILGKEGVRAVSEWWERTAQKLGKATTPDMDLPVIKQSWGKGPQVFVHKPIYKPGTMPPVDLGMENYLNNRIRPLSADLAEDMGRMFREGVEVNTKLNNILKAGERYTISATDEIAVRVMNNPSYKQAVREGLVPASAQQAVYQARDKICKNAMQAALEQLDNHVIDGKPASSYIDSIAITGTGAKPLSPQAIGRYTDFDATVFAGRSNADMMPGRIQSIYSESDAARRAEQLFADSFDDYVRAAGLDPGTADVNMFQGLRPGELSTGPGGYISEPMVHWQKVDMVNRGRTAIRSSETGSLIFDNHPDVAPLQNFGPTDPVPHFPLQPEAAAADARGVIIYHTTRALRESGENLTQGAILRQEGKHAMRVWKTANAGRGLQPPTWIKRLEELKRNPDIQLSTRETAQLWENFSNYLDLPPDIGV